MRARQRGFLAVAAAAALWAFGGTYARRLIDRGASPLEITEARAWISFAILGTITLFSKRRREARDRPRTAALIVMLFGLAIAGANYF